MPNSDKPDNLHIFPKSATLNPDKSDPKPDAKGPADAGRGSGSANDTSKIDTRSIDEMLASLKAKDAPQPASPTGTPQTVQPPEQRHFTAFDVPLGPRPQRSRTHDFLGPEAHQKTVNYIFTVGRQGSGKSTFQSHLLRYLYTQGDHNVEPDVEHARSTQSDFRNIVLTWREQWQRGQFPAATTIGRPSEFRYIVTPNMGKHAALPFGFLEISGEDFIQLAKPTQNGEAPPALMSSIDDFLNNPKANLAFLFVCQGENILGDDILFSEFLDYLKINIRRDFEKHCSAVLVLSDPDTCQRRLARKMNLPDDGRPLDVEKFVEQFVPQCASRLAKWKNRATIATFSVGAIREEKDPTTGKMVPFIRDPSFEDAKLIYDWLYERFTGKRIGIEDGVGAKFRKWFKQLAKLGGG